MATLVVDGNALLVRRRYVDNDFVDGNGFVDGNALLVRRRYVDNAFVDGNGFVDGNAAAAARHSVSANAGSDSATGIV